MDQAFSPLDIPLPRKGAARGLFGLMARPVLRRLLCLGAINDLYARVGERDAGERFLREALSILGVDFEIDEADLARVPESGPVVVTANHPFGAVEGIILAALLARVRPDVKLMANRFLAHVPQLAPMIIPVDPFGTAESANRNVAGLKESLLWLRGGKLLGVFPAGEVSALSVRGRGVADRPWNPVVGRLIQKTGARVVPAHFAGANGVLFQLLGLIHPRLRTMLLPREMLNKRERTIRVRLGAPIAPSRLAGFTDPAELMRYLRLCTYVLGNRAERVAPALSVVSGQSALASAPRASLLASEMEALPDECRLMENQRELVFAVEAGRIPETLVEIGRLREKTFREVGEGTGKPLDLDEFDRSYLHLGLWDKTSRQIVGAYRLGRTDRLLAAGGPSALYSHSLFSLSRRFLAEVDPGLEMGRSFVRASYQKGFSPLLTLWKGIGRYVAANPRYAVLFGPVSISADYAELSRELIMRYLSGREGAGLGRAVKPRTPPKYPPLPLSSMVVRAAGRVCRDLDDLAGLVSAVEADGKGVPVLVRQYVKLGGKLAAFNVDKGFAGALDGLIMVDLRKTDPRVLARYMGLSGAQDFLARHKNARS